MALDDVKQSIISNVTNAYTKAADKGAAVPENKNLENLATTIESIVTGITPEGTIEIRENGKYDVTNMSEADVLVTGEIELTDRTINKLDFSEGDVIISPKFTEGGVLNLLEDIKIISKSSFNVYSSYMQSSIQASGYNAVSGQITFEFYNPTDGDVSVTLTRVGNDSQSGNGVVRVSKPDMTVAEGIATSMNSYTAGPYTTKVPNVPKGYHTLQIQVYAPQGWGVNFKISNITTAQRVSDADGLTEVTLMKPETLVESNIPQGVKLFGVSGTALLMDNYIQSGVTSLINTNVSQVGSNVFAGNRVVSMVSLPNCITVYPSAFQSATALRSVYLENCKTIQSSAFLSCTGLSTLVLGEAISSIGQWAFTYAKLKGLELTGSSISIGTYAFASNTSLSYVSLPNLTGTLNSAFQNCTSLKSVYAPNITGTAMQTFSNCQSLSDVQISSCEYVGVQTFMSCYKLSEIDLPNCKTIASSAFGYCSSLASISLPQCTTIGGTYAFTNCVSLANISLPAISGSIGSSCFYNCSALSQVYLGSNCGLLQTSMFYNCKKLAKVIIMASNCEMFSNAFYYTPMSVSSYLGTFGSIYVPDDYVSDYQTRVSVYSSRFAPISKIPADVIETSNKRGTTLTVSAIIVKKTLNEFDGYTIEAGGQ